MSPSSARSATTSSRLATPLCVSVRPTPPPSDTPARRGKPGEHQTERTVYVLRGSSPGPVQIKTGISDGIFTEVLGGLKEGDRVVTAMTGRSANSAQPSNNPLAGGQRRF